MSTTMGLRVSVTTELRAAVEAKARGEGRTLNEVITALLEDYTKKTASKPKRST